MSEAVVLGLSFMLAFRMPMPVMLPDMPCTATVLISERPAIEFIDALPRTETGKVQRFKLREA